MKRFAACVALAMMDFAAPAGLGLSSLGRRVVTLAMGTVNALVRERASISAVTDMPGRNGSFSLMRIFTLSLAFPNKI